MARTADRGPHAGSVRHVSRLGPRARGELEARSTSARMHSMRDSRCSTEAESTRPWCYCSRRARSDRSARRPKPPRSCRLTSGILELAQRAPARIVPLAAGSTRMDGSSARPSAHPSYGPRRGRSELDELVRRDALLFVHPGRRVRRRELRRWAAVVDYTAQMQAARALAGQGHRALARAQGRIRPARRGAPFQLERLRSRGVSGRDVLHPNVFFETSSYGNRARALPRDVRRGQWSSGPTSRFSTRSRGLDAVRGFGDAVADALATRTRHDCSAQGLTRWIHERVPRTRTSIARHWRSSWSTSRASRASGSASSATTRRRVISFQLYRDPHLDLWLICWLDAQDTGYHDHDVSSGAVYVCDGTLHEDHFERRPTAGCTR